MYEIKIGPVISLLLYLVQSEVARDLELEPDLPPWKESECELCLRPLDAKPVPDRSSTPVVITA